MGLTQIFNDKPLDEIRKLIKNEQPIEQSNITQANNNNNNQNDSEVTINENHDDLLFKIKKFKNKFAIFEKTKKKLIKKNYKFYPCANFNTNEAMSNGTDTNNNFNHSKLTHTINISNSLHHSISSITNSINENTNENINYNTTNNSQALNNSIKPVEDSSHNVNTLTNKVTSSEVMVGLISNKNQLYDSCREFENISLISNESNSKLKAEIANDGAFKKSVVGGVGYGAKLWFDKTNNKFYVLFEPNGTMANSLKALNFDTNNLFNQKIQFTLPDSIKDEDKAEIATRFKMNPLNAFLHYCDTSSNAKIDIVQSTDGRIVSLKNDISPFTNSGYVNSTINTLSSGVKLVKTIHNISYFHKKLATVFKDNKQIMLVINTINNIGSKIIEKNAETGDNFPTNKLFEHLFNKNWKSGSPEEKISFLSTTKLVLKKIYNNDQDIINLLYNSENTPDKKCYITKVFALFNTVYNSKLEKATKNIGEQLQQQKITSQEEGIA